MTRLSILATIAMLLCTLLCCAQTELANELLYRTGNETVVKKDKRGVYYAMPDDSSYTIYRDNDQRICRLYDKEDRMLVEGNIVVRNHSRVALRSGRWTEYYKSGKIKFKGYYIDNHPVGLWQYFYPSGKFKKLYSIAFVETDTLSGYCKVGTYQEYYPNGHLKILGCYGINTTCEAYDTIPILDPETLLEKTLLLRRPAEIKIGIWQYFSENGKLEREEENPE
jgi:antitoxin component YwqK of YwqJK toxin-antitoxin module